MAYKEDDANAPCTKPASYMMADKYILEHPVPDRESLASLLNSVALAAWYVSTPMKGKG